MNAPKGEETIFATALALPPEERARYLDKSCRDDANLRQRVEVLLQAHAGGGFLEEPAAPVAAQTLRISPAISERPGDMIGRYKLLQQIGEGGCGVVYMAEQEEPVQRRVALKVIKLGMDTKQVIARFEAERQALAMMDHPNIAKVLDGGATETGRPYFVMELVRGVKITEYCDHNNLPTDKRLELFMQVCRAIQHAHQKGIIHRDIKPSNILVTLHDGVPVPKVIDFGIAKATQGRLTDMTLFTAFEQFIGTPAYMSPEQAELSGLDIDTRSDIYSLGVLLYELLTGKTPFDASALLKAGLDEMRRTIREQEPERPSTKLSTMVDGELTSTAKRHHTEPPKLVSAVRGDLDWIVMKCLEKDRARRYETANGLGMDIQRHLNNEPVTACPPSNFDRLQKLVHRNKLAFSAGAAVVGALVLGTAVSLWQAVVATRARASAITAQKQAEQARISEAEQRQKAVVARDQARHQELDARANLYVANVALANEALRKDHLDRARELLRKAALAAAAVAPSGTSKDPPGKDLRGWEWRYLWAETRGDDLFILGRHDPCARVALWMPDGVRAVSCGDDNLVKIWNVAERRLLNQVSLDGRPRGLALSPEATRLAVGLEDGRVSLWNSSTLQKIWEVKFPEMVGRVAYSPDGEMIAASSDEGVFVLWAKDGGLRHSLTNSPLAQHQDIAGLAFSPDSRSLVYGVWQKNELGVLNLQDGTQEIVSMGEGACALALAFSPDGCTLAGGDNFPLVTVWDWPGRRVKRLFRSHLEPVFCTTFSPDGTRLASAGWDQTIKLWDTRTWAEIGALHGHVFQVNSVDFSPNSQRLLSASRDGTVRVWSATPPTRRHQLALPLGTLRLLRMRHQLAFPMGEGTLVRISWEETNRTLLTMNTRTGGFTVADLFTGEVVRQGALDPRALVKASGAVYMLDKIALAFQDGRVDLYDLRSQDRLWSVTNRTRAVTAMHGSAKRAEFALGYEDGRIDLVRVENGSVERTLPGTNAQGIALLAFNRQGERLLTSGSSRQELLVWNLDNGELKRVRHQHGESLLSARLSDDGEWVVTTGRDAFASVWEVASGREVARFTSQFTGFRSAAISPDKTRVALTSENRDELSVWDPVTEERLLTRTGESVLPVGGQVIGWDASGDNLVGLFESKLRIWHAPSLAEIEAAEGGRPLPPVAWKTEQDRWYGAMAEREDPIGLNNIAWVLATSEDPEDRDGATAVRLAEKAVARTDRQDPLILATLAAAYAETGQFARAVSAQREAITLCNEESMRRDMVSRLKLFESQTPYRPVPEHLRRPHP
jgi:WD40 repeat protein/serine/threonine protein kinase